MHVCDTTEVKVDVTSTNSVAGEAIAQIYIHQRYGTASLPVRWLNWFERIAVKPSERKALTFPLENEELKCWNPQTKQWVWNRLNSTGASRRFYGEPARQFHHAVEETLHGPEERVD